LNNLTYDQFLFRVNRFDKASQDWLKHRLLSRWWPRDMRVAARYITQQIGSAPFYLYGAGSHSLGLIDLLQGNELLNQLLGVLDGHPRPGQKVHSFDVFPADYALEECEGKIVLSHAEFEDGMLEDLLRMGIPRDRIVPIYQDEIYGQMAMDTLWPDISTQLANIPERGSQKRIVFVNARDRRIFDDNIIGYLKSLGRYQLIQVQMDRLESVRDTSCYDMTLSARNGIGLCLNILEHLQPDLIYVQEHYSSGNFLPLIPALAFPGLPVVGEFYDFLGLIFDDPYILSRDSYWREKDVQLGMDAERWCIENLGGIVTKESGGLLKEYLAGANYLEVQPHLARASFVERQTSPEQPLRLVWAGAIAPSHLSSAIIGNNQLIDVFSELVELGFSVTAFSSCPDWATLESQYPDYLELAKSENFKILPRIPQQELIVRMANEFDYGIAFGRLKEGHQQGLSNKITVSGKIFSYVAAGLPILVADYYEVMGEWVEKYDLGVLVNPDQLDCLPEILAQHNYLETVENIYRYRNQHNLDALLEEVTGFIDDVLTEQVVESP